MDQNREKHSISMMCRIYGVSRDGYNSWRRRGVCERRREDSELFEHIRSIFDRHDGCYGSPKITEELRKRGIYVGQKRVARIMRNHGLKAVKSRIYTARPGMYTHVYGITCKIEGIKVSRPNQLWVGDVTYIKLRDGSWQYLSVVMDRYSRKIVAWSLSDRRDVSLTLSSIDRAVRNRGHHRELIFHSDRGSEYLSGQYRERLRRYGITQSMNRVKNMNDNAFIESFFHQFKTERIKRLAVDSAEQLRSIVTGYMRYYNTQRSHSSIGYVSPHEFECKINC
ncbi:IS3 family transposase [Microbulbifer taiwanensis]|uniref:IS3 family transposase n=1 Tax=Microbulbifer taiwanensis TaxID=986746 RepID=A0ABW1YP72_9GAMM